MNPSTMEHQSSMPTVDPHPTTPHAVPARAVPSPPEDPHGPRRRSPLRALGAALLVALLGFGGGIAGYFAADEWLAEDDAVTTSAPLAQPSNDSVSEPAESTPVAAPGDLLAPATIYDRVAPAVVHIEAVTEGEQSFFGSTPDSVGTGSGFVIDDQGHIVTNAHVVDGAEELTVSFGEDITVTAKLVGEDTFTDLAVIKVDPKDEQLRGKLRTVELGDSTRVKVGDPVVAIGNPFSLDRTLTTGVVSALQREIPALDEGYEIRDVIQTDAAINPGNSGGPLLDMTGKVIGVNSQIQSTTRQFAGIAFAVPSSTVRNIAEQLIETGKVEHAWLGLAGRAVSPELAEALDLPVEEGVLVGDVSSGGPADEAGLQAGSRDVVIEGTDIRPGGDVILRFDGEEVTSMRQLAALVDAKRPGDEVEIEFLQDGRKKTSTVELGTRPASDGGGDE